MSRLTTKARRAAARRRAGYRRRAGRIALAGGGYITGNVFELAAMYGWKLSGPYKVEARA